MKVNQLQMDFGEPVINRPDTARHAFIAKSLAESPTGEIRLMESIC